MAGIKEEIIRFITRPKGEMKPFKGENSVYILTMPPRWTRPDALKAALKEDCDVPKIQN